MSKTDIEAATEYAEAMLKHEVDYMKEHRPHLLTEVTPERMAEWKQGQFQAALERIAEIRVKESALRRLRNGMFQPSNKNSRKLFEHVAGFKLPSGAKATYEAVKKWIGEDFVEAVFAAETKEAEERKAAKAAEKKAEWERHIASVSQNVRDDKEITGSDLLDLCRELGVEVHLRTQGSMLKNLVSIHGSGARIRGKSDTTLIWRAYRSCVAILNEPVDEEPVDPEVLKLFAGSKS